MPEDEIVENMIPHHVAIIMDGNNRWARRQGLPGTAGHRAGVEAVREILRTCRDHGVQVLTLFAFSSENWGRPQPEVRALLALLSRYLRSEVRSLHEDGIRLRFIGERSRFSERLQRLMRQSEQLTADNTVSTVVIAVDYGGQWDIAQAVQQYYQWSPLSSVGWFAHCRASAPGWLIRLRAWPSESEG